MIYIVILYYGKKKKKRVCYILVVIFFFFKSSLSDTTDRGVVHENFPFFQRDQVEDGIVPKDVCNFFNYSIMLYAKMCSKYRYLIGINSVFSQ